MMTLVDACNIADEYYKSHKCGKITSVSEGADAFSFTCEQDKGFSSNPLFISKNGKFETKRRGFMFVMEISSLTDIELPEQYR